MLNFYWLYRALKKDCWKLDTQHSDSMPCHIQSGWNVLAHDSLAVMAVAILKTQVVNKFNTFTKM